MIRQKYCIIIMSHLSFTALLSGLVFSIPNDNFSASSLYDSVDYDPFCSRLPETIGCYSTDTSLNAWRSAIPGATSEWVQVFYFY